MEPVFAGFSDAFVFPAFFVGKVRIQQALSSVFSCFFGFFGLAGQNGRFRKADQIQKISLGRFHPAILFCRLAERGIFGG